MDHRCTMDGKVGWIHMKKWFAVVVVVIILGIAGGLFLRLHNAVYIKPMNEYAVPEQVVSYRQDDRTWAEDRLGDSSYSMKSSGCLVTCMASAISNSGKAITPGELNQLFSDSQVYDDAGNVQWDRIRDLEGYSVEVFDSVSKQKLDQCLSQGHYPIVRVRMHGFGNFHFVLIVGTREGEYLCMDPLEDDLTKLSRYGNMVYGIRLFASA